jgi:hypothetical protein
MIRLGLIGPGAWGKNYITAVKDSGNAELAWMASRGWMEQPKVDGIIIATPPKLRPEIILSQLGVPMMVEKPLCLTLRLAEILRAAPGLDIFLVDYEALRQIVREYPKQLSIESDVAHTTLREYSVLWDHAPHDLAMCLGMGLEVEEVRNVPSFEIGHGGMRALLSDDSLLNLSIRTGAKKRTFTVRCGGREAIYDGIAGTLDINGERVVTQSEPPLTRAVRAFAKAIKDDGTDDWRFGIDSSVAITKVLEGVQNA